MQNSNLKYQALLYSLYTEIIHVQCVLSNLKMYFAVREALFVPSRHSPTAAKDILRDQLYSFQTLSLLKLFTTGIYTLHSTGNSG